MIRIFQISKLGLIVAATFVILLVSFRLTLPFGDEPDFVVRSVQLTDSEWSEWTIYAWAPGILKSIATTSNCKIEASALSLAANIDFASCTELLEQMLLRSALTLLVVFPLMIFIVWRVLIVKILKLTVASDQKELNVRLDAFSLSILVPGMIYYLSLLSHEQLTLVISLFIFPFWGNRIIVIALVALVASIDAGNAAVLAGFIAINQISILLIKRVGAKFTIIIGLLSLGIINSISNELMPYIGLIPMLQERAAALFSLDSSINDLREKYPVVLRPLVTFTHFFLSTPAGVKVIPVHILAIIAIFIGGLRFRRQYKMTLVNIGKYDSTGLVLASSALYTIFFFTFLLPGYANGKYYIFLIPFFVYFFLDVFSKWSIYFFLVCCSALVPLALILYRLLS